MGVGRQRRERCEGESENGVEERKRTAGCVRKERKEERCEKREEHRDGDSSKIA